MPLISPYPAAVHNVPALQADNPQSILLNGHGFYQDCALGPGGNTKNISCDVTSQWVPKGRSVQNPFAAATNPGEPPFTLRL